MDNLGTKIREFRRSRSMTLKQLAEAAKLSVSFLSEIERGLAQPSMASLKRIRKVLGISLLNLQDAENLAELPGSPPLETPLQPSRGPYITDARVVKAGQRKKLAYPGRPGFYELLTPDLNRNLEVLYFKMESDFDTGPEVLLDPPGEKCMVLLNGEVEFRVGDEAFDLCAGDSLSYPADAPVSWTVRGDAPFEGILIVTPPGF